MSYNGWTNYETWCVGLWLGNEPSTENDMADMARGYDDDNAHELSEKIKSYVEDLAPENMGWGLFSDLLTSSLGEVNWREIAESYIVTYKDPEEKE